MTDLSSLIRVRKHAVEQKQKALAALYARAQGFKDERDALSTQLAIEQEKTKNMDAELLNYFGPYAEKVQNQIESIDQKRSDLERQIVKAQDIMREAFAELKKVEIIDQRRKDAKTQALDKLEAEELDEIALEAFRRKDE